MVSSALYLGGLPPHSAPHPPQMWSATSGAGLVGCIRDLVMDGRSVQLAEVARTQDLGMFVLPPSCQAGFLCHLRGNKKVY